MIFVATSLSVRILIILLKIDSVVFLGGESSSAETLVDLPSFIGDTVMPKSSGGEVHSHMIGVDSTTTHFPRSTGL